MATTIGEATIKLTFDNKELDKSAATAKGKVNSALKTLGTTAKVAGKIIGAGMTVAAAATAKLAGDAVVAYKDFEQLSGGMKKIFDEVDYDQIAEDASKAYESMNISAAEYMEQMAGVGATFAQTMGDQKGYDTAKRGMQALADYASGTGKSVDLLMEKYQAITRSASGYLSIADQFAGILPQTTTDFLKQAQEAGYLSGEYKKLTEVPVAEYQEAITKMIEDGVGKMGLLGNTAEETAKTISGSIAGLKSQWNNTLNALVSGEDIEGNIDRLVDSIIKVVDNLTPAFEAALNGIATLVEKGVPMIAERLPGMLEKTLPSIATAAVAIVTAITNVLPTLAPVLADSLSVLVEELVPYLPQIIGSLMQAILTFWVEGWKHTFEIFGEMFSVAFETYGGIAMDAINKIKAWLYQAGLWVYHNVLQPVGAFFNGLWNGIKAGAQGVGNAIRSIFGAIVGFVKAPINAIIDGVNKILGKINGIKIPDWVPGIGGAHTNFATIPKLAQGGIATRATGAMIGEAGTEAVIPLERNTGNWAGLLASAIRDEFESEEMTIGGGMTVYMTNNINNNLDADEIGQRLMTSIRRAA